MYCTFCGNKINSNDKYCTSCGRKILNYNNSINNKKKFNKSNITLILSILSLLLMNYPIISIILAVISLLMIKESDHKKDIKLLSIISIILACLSIIFRIGIYYFWDYTNDNFEYYNESEIFDIRGYSFISQDNSILYLNSDNTYNWNTTSNKMEGTYKYYQQEDAKKYLDKIIGNDNYFDTYLFNNYYLLILESTDADDLIYFGYFDLDDQSLNLININSYKTIKFFLNEKLSKIDI